MPNKTTISSGDFFDDGVLDRSGLFVTNTIPLSALQGTGTTNLNLANEVYITGEDNPTGDPYNLIGLSSANISVVGNTTYNTVIDSLATVTIPQSLVVTGDLTVNGTTTTIDTANLTVEDNVITINDGEAGTGVGNGTGTAGITVDRGLAPNNAELLFDENDDQWKVDPGTGSLENVIQNTWNTFTTDSGTTVGPTTPTSSMSIVGGTGIDTEVIGNDVVVNFNGGVSDSSGIFMFSEWSRIKTGFGAGVEVKTVINLNDSLTPATLAFVDQGVGSVDVLRSTSGTVWNNPVNFVSFSINNEPLGNERDFRHAVFGIDDDTVDVLDMAIIPVDDGEVLQVINGGATLPGDITVQSVGGVADMISAGHDKAQTWYAGNSVGSIYYSTNQRTGVPPTWTAAITSGVSLTAVTGFASNGTVTVAVGINASGGHILTAPAAGTTFTKVTDTDTILSAVLGSDLLDVATDGVATFVAVGDDQGIYTSLDSGATWTAVAHDSITDTLRASYQEANAEYTSVVYGNGYFVILQGNDGGTNNGALLASKDGLSWFRIDQFQLGTGFLGGDTSALFSLTFSEVDKNWVIGGEDFIATSIDSKIEIAAGIATVTNAENLDGLDSTDFVRATDSVNQTVTGIKTFNSNVTVNGNSAASTFNFGADNPGVASPIISYRDLQSPNVNSDGLDLAVSSTGDPAIVPVIGDAQVSGANFKFNSAETAWEVEGAFISGPTSIYLLESGIA
jgi:hypothetical protein